MLSKTWVQKKSRGVNGFGVLLPKGSGHGQSHWDTQGWPTNR